MSKQVALAFRRFESIIENSDENHESFIEKSSPKSEANTYIMPNSTFKSKFPQSQQKLSGLALASFIAKRTALEFKQKAELKNDPHSIAAKEMNDMNIEFKKPPLESISELEFKQHNGPRRILSTIAESSYLENEYNETSNITEGFMRKEPTETNSTRSQPIVEVSNQVNSLPGRDALEFKSKSDLKNGKELNETKFSSVMNTDLTQSPLSLPGSALDKAIALKNSIKNNESNLIRPHTLKEEFVDDSDQNLIVIKKKSEPIEQIQNVHIKYLKPPPLSPPGDIVIHQEPDIQLPPEPPIYIRENATPSESSNASRHFPKTIVIREAPPPMPEPIPEVHITIPGKILPPPPRQIIKERFPSRSPSPPPTVIYEKWLPHETRTRRVVYHENERSNSPSQFNDGSTSCLNLNGGVYRHCNCMNCYYFEKMNANGKYIVILLNLCRFQMQNREKNYSGSFIFCSLP